MYEANVHLGFFPTYEQARQQVRKYLRTQQAHRENRQPLSPMWIDFVSIKNLDVKTSK